LVLFVVLGLQSTVAFGADPTGEIVPLERAGVNLYLERYQTDEGGKPILLVHGLTYSSHEFHVDYEDYSLVRFLANNGYAVWLLDIAGYGRSRIDPAKAPEGFTGFTPDSDYAADDIKAAVDKILEKTPGAAKLDVLGWSWGTVTSGRFAAKYADLGLVNKLVLYAPIVVGFGAPEGHVKEEYQVTSWLHAADDFQPIDVPGVISYDIIERAVADTFLSNCWRYDEKSPNGGRRDLMEGSNSLIPMEQIKVPTLLIAGSVDPYIFKYVENIDLDEVVKKLPNKGSKVEIIPGAAHAVMMEKSYKDFQKRVLDFLASAEPAAKGGSGGCSVGLSAGILALGEAIAAAWMK
jgi:pimeloyl-ACP methyl ester carboxylesterase